MLRLLAFCLFGVLLCSTVAGRFIEDEPHSLEESEGNSMSLNCHTNEFIHIQSAAYGLPEQDCFAGRSMEVAVYECNGQQSCTLYAENTAFGDPCVGVVKKLAVKYSCEPTPPSQGVLRRACEDDTIHIDCPGTIDIILANYGRTTGKHICSGGAATNTNCGDAESIDIVRTECQGKQTCLLEASNNVFGDPCMYIQKYLEVRYECV